METRWSLATTVSGEFFSEIYKSNVLLAARARRHTARAFQGPLSIKGVVRGEGSWVVGGRSFLVDSTSCLVVDRNEPYDLTIDSLGEVQTFVVFFADGLVKGVADAVSRPIEALLDDPEGVSGRTLPVSQRLWTEGEPIHRALMALRLCAGDPLEQGEVDRHLRNALESLTGAADQVAAERRRIDAAQTHTRHELHQRAQRGKAHLDATIEESFDLGAAARAACMAPHHFHRTFRAVFGRTPFGYVSERRVARARRLLAENDWPVADICIAVGYESLPSFTRRFKQATGFTPAAFRARWRAQGIPKLRIRKSG